jgi:hypothetical protein
MRSALLAGRIAISFALGLEQALKTQRGNKRSPGRWRVPMRTTAIFLFCVLVTGCSGGGNSSAIPAPQAGQAQSAERAATTATKTYTVPAGACAITGCVNAPLLFKGVKVNTIGYTDGVTYFVNTNTAGTVTFGTRRFADFTGTFTNTGSTTISGLTYWVWTLAGKFSGGTDSLKEVFDVRGHSGRGGGNTIINSGGIVVTPLVTPAPTPPSPSPTPVPTATDS